VKNFLAAVGERADRANRGHWLAASAVHEAPGMAGCRCPVLPKDECRVLRAAGCLLTQLKSTCNNPSLGVTDLWQEPGYVCRRIAVTDAASLSARCGYLAQWTRRARTATSEVMPTRFSSLAIRPAFKIRPRNSPCRSSKDKGVR
jgi:hypothetical protein